MLITKKSLLSNVIHTMEIPIEESKYKLWLEEVLLQGNKRTLIQDAFPDLTADQREFIMTGITPEEWDQMFSNPD
jgi:hypothetical protein